MLALVAAVALFAPPQTRTPVLTYHDIIERRDAKALWFDCTTSELRDQLDWLTAKGARFISLAQLYDHLAYRKPLPPKSIVLTFADNYLGFYTRALPILRRRRIPAAMFVHTAYVGSRVGRPKMTWTQLQELDREGLITIASQTVNHPPDLRTLDEPHLAFEMTASKRELEKRLGHPVPYLAYPNGKWNNRCADAARRAGYAMAFTEDLQPAETAASLFTVPRYVHTKYRRAWADANRP